MAVKSTRWAGSVLRLMPPSANTTWSSSALASGESSISLAASSSCWRSWSQASFTAVPTEETVKEPPSSGALGRVESPSLKVTLSSGRPRFSAAIWVITV